MRQIHFLLRRIWISILLARVLLHQKQYPEKTKKAFQLETILFCHCEPHKICSIHIRKNAKETWNLPEWKRDRKESENAPAVYRLARFQSNDDKLEIRATFTIINPTIESIQYQVRVNGGDVLGMSKTKVVTCTKGTTEHTVFFAFPEAGELLLKKGINKQEISLSWEYAENVQKTADIEFIRFHLSKHQIYTIFDSVRAPWGSTERTFQNDLGLDVRVLYPMTDIYDATIDIVRNIMTPDVAKSAITNHIYNSLFYVYNGMWALGLTNYIDVIEFQDYILHASIQDKKNVNCQDCATLVGTIANLYGCYLTYLGLGRNFKVKEIKLIGEEKWRLPEGTQGEGYFGYHYIAIDGQYNQNDSATFCYDACFQYKGNVSGNVKLALHEQLAANPQNPGVDTYKESVCVPNGATECNVEANGEFFFAR